MYCMCVVWIVIQIAGFPGKQWSLKRTEAGIEFVNCMSLQNANEPLYRKISASAKMVVFFLLGSVGLEKGITGNVK